MDLHFMEKPTGIKMKAVVYQNRGVIKVEEVEQPGIESSTDAVIKVTSASICASDK